MKTKEMKLNWELEWQGYGLRFTNMTYTEVCEEMEGLVDLSYCRLNRTQPLKALQPLSEPLVEPVRALKKGL